MRANTFGQLGRFHTFCLVGICLATLGSPSVARAQIPDLGINASLNGAIPFPPNNPWNQDISQLPVDPNSANLIASIGLNTGLHPDFGAAYWNGAPNGIPYVVVAGTQPLLPITAFTYADQSDPGPYPIPTNAPIEGGPNSNGDRHVLVIDRDHWNLFELYNAWPNNLFTAWTADSGAIFNLNSNALRPLFWTSADAAGLPVFPGLVRADEVFDQGVILHALRFTVAQTRRAFTSPARHFASNHTGPNFAPMGMRVRLKASFDITAYPPQVQVILTALKTYGMFVADNGSNWFLSGAPDARWNDTALHTLTQITGSNFEVVAMGDVITDLVGIPANLTGTSGNGGVRLSWSASSGASGYTLKRASVSGGPYTTLVSNQAASSYTDASVSSGSAYYYVVSGVCSTGQSPNSTEVSVTAGGGGGVTLSLSSLTLAPSTLTGGTSSQGSVILSGAAPAGGVLVSLSSGNVGVATLPASVRVGAGQTSAVFTVSTSAVPTSTAVSILGTLGSSTQSATLTLQSGTGTNPAPKLSSVSPSSATHGSGSVTITCTGTGFVASSTVRFFLNGKLTNLTTTYISPTTLTADIPSTLLGSAGSGFVGIVNPAPGGGSSGGLTFTIK